MTRAPHLPALRALLLALLLALPACAATGASSDAPSATVFPTPTTRPVCARPGDVVRDVGIEPTAHLGRSAASRSGATFLGPDDPDRAGGAACIDGYLAGRLLVRYSLQPSSLCASGPTSGRRRRRARRRT
jgi:hypothetical protein